MSGEQRFQIGSIVVAQFEQERQLVQGWIDRDNMVRRGVPFEMPAVVVAMMCHAWGSVYLCVCASSDSRLFLAQWMSDEEVAAMPGVPDGGAS